MILTLGIVFMLAIGRAPDCRDVLGILCVTSGARNVLRFRNFGGTVASVTLSRKFACCSVTVSFNSYSSISNAAKTENNETPEKHQS